MAANSLGQRSLLPLILGLLVLLGLVLLLLPTINASIKVGVQSKSEGQCQSAGQIFDEKQEAFTLAQVAEQYRSANPTKANYGLASYTICYKDDSLQQRVQSAPFRGSNNLTNKNYPKNYTHSEQSAYSWLQNKLSSQSLDMSQVVATYAVIFSQVIVCDECEQDMVSWQRTLRTIAKTNNLYLSIWDILPGKGFDPAAHPAGSGKPVAIGELRKVPIKFAVSPFSIYENGAIV